MTFLLNFYILPKMIFIILKEAVKQIMHLDLYTRSLHKTHFSTNHSCMQIIYIPFKAIVSILYVHTCTQAATHLFFL